MANKQKYIVKLTLERFNDGKYKAEVALGGGAETSGYPTRDDLFVALDSFKQRLIDYEDSLDSE